MAATVTVYSFEDNSGSEYGSFTTQDYAEAKKYAADNKLLVVANEYEWQESHPLEDYRDEEKEWDGPTIYNVKYRVEAAGGGTVVERKLKVPAASEKEAREKLTKFVLDHDPYYDDRIEPRLVIDYVEDTGDPAENDEIDEVD